MKFGIVVNTNRPRAIAAGKELISWMRKEQIDFVLDANSAENLKESPSVEMENMHEQADFFVSLGGDGTLLGVSHFSNTKPIIGINLGRLGFLAEFCEHEMYDVIKRVLQNNFMLENRTQLEVSVSGKGQVRNFTGLNDVVIEKGTYPGVPVISVSIDNNLVSEYRADGVIIATSTGSTGYSLSAGGPIIIPKSKVFVVTPVCPHMLTVRPMVICDDKEIEVRVETPGDRFVLNCDGMLIQNISPSHQIRVRKAKNTVNLIANERRNYYNVLRQKFHWGKEQES
ncbi:ATP-NAD/AcoX kinase [Chloroherpeton thalassium ATCC 35110]|uniref:NAD kinase n=1 Tax=Chloroherpeton thalassium (strain ATCC 35110 / GB-78) TaxID=517418 RepID=NADK_CHLT3|nr:NAD(+)/NADH kinase [Chloroherpeton thalassium]B3QYG7.1 RecName: Full=NAD kinase; AltName: Full=ATP-dependent NAD kinase [Chloroherpeton thalassium ATCC 35110]ACF13595.1 ATP-NAD/AcoX kinase [Chloroherpeton thalassium ATCC 35110]